MPVGQVAYLALMVGSAGLLSPILKAPAGRYVCSQHGKTNPKAPAGRHVSHWVMYDISSKSLKDLNDMR